MYRSVHHWRPLLNGYGSYWPRGFPAIMETARRVPDRDALARLRRETGLRTVLVDRRHLRPEDRRQWDRVLRAPAHSGLRLVAADDVFWLFEPVP
jgi:hypothetical protein